MNFITWKDFIDRFMQKKNPFSKIIQLHQGMASFTQKIEDCLSKGWGRFSKLVNRCLNHDFANYVILHIYYNGLNDESKQTLDGSASGACMSLMVDEVERLIETIVTTREQ